MKNLVFRFLKFRVNCKNQMEQTEPVLSMAVTDIRSYFVITMNKDLSKNELSRQEL